MRKIISFSFIAVLFINLFGYFISFSVQRYKIRAEIKQMLKQEKRKHTHQFVFTEAQYNQLNQYEGGREFNLNGCMYDVVKKELKAGKIILTAYFDHQETGLLDKLISFFDEENSSQDGNQLAAFSMLEFIFSPAEQKQCDFNTRPSFYSNSHNELPAISFDIASPPPDFLFS